MLTEERKQELIGFTQKMIQTQSYSGQEENVVKEMQAFCKKHGNIETFTDAYGNCICHIKGNRPGPKVLFDGHMDTVPVPNPEKWTHDPFGGEICDGKMYGRGTSDMKGALSAMLAAAVYYEEDTKGDFCGDIYVAGVCHEECFEGVAARSISSMVKPDYVVIGEASHLNLKVGQRGRAEIKVETYGIPAHSANPEKGLNAVYSMCRVIEAIRKIVPPHQDQLGDGILELTDIKSSPYPGASVVPDYCCATYDRRLLVGETKESVLAPLKEVLDQLMKEDLGIKAKVSYALGKEKCWTGEMIQGERFFPGWLFDKEEKWIQDIYHEMRSIGLDPVITNYNFCTNGSHYAGEAGIKTIGVGPSLESLAHTVDEYIELDQLLKVMESYYGVMKALLK